MSARNEEEPRSRFAETNEQKEAHGEAQMHDTDDDEQVREDGVLNLRDCPRCEHEVARSDDCGG